MPRPLRFRRTRSTPPRTWQPLSDAEWAALAPFLRCDGTRGRPIEGGARARLDACFRIVAGGLRWAEASDTVHRQFRHWAKAGLFARLLREVAKGKRAKQVPEALRAITHWICAAHRRSVRVCGVGAIALARRLGMSSALPGPSWLLPDPVLSELAQKEIAKRLEVIETQRPTPREWRLLRHLLKVAGGRLRIPRCLVPS